MLDLEELFEKFEDEGCEFDRIVDPPSHRPDLCAFILLDKLFPQSHCGMISGADHDVIFLDIDRDELAEVATEDDILYLVRCGVTNSDEYDCLAMFV